MSAKAIAAEVNRGDFICSVLKYYKISNDDGKYEFTVAYPPLKNSAFIDVVKIGFIDVNGICIETAAENINSKLNSTIDNWKEKHMKRKRKVTMCPILMNQNCNDEINRNGGYDVSVHWVGWFSKQSMFVKTRLFYNLQELNLKKKVRILILRNVGVKLYKRRRFNVLNGRYHGFEIFEQDCKKTKGFNDNM